MIFSDLQTKFIFNLIHIYQTQYLVFKTLTIITDAKHLDEKGETSN